MSETEAALVDAERAFGTLGAESWKSPKKEKSAVMSSCRICLSNIWDPARLGCGHRFCEHCLNSYWTANERPEFVTCPLCRDPAFIVGFVPKEDVDSTRDFRKKFDPKFVDIITATAETKNRTTALCLKLSLIFPAIYFMVKYLRPAIMNIILK